VKIGIIGHGMVGEVVNYGMRRIGHDTIVVDKKIAGTNLRQVIDTDLVFVCVPTPGKPNGACDVSIVESVVRELSTFHYKGEVVIKSTVTPGTTERLSRECSGTDTKISFCPEFLKERSRFVDFVENHDVCIIGAHEEDLSSFEKIKEAHGTLPKQFVWLSPTEAEMAKYFSNCFNALRIVFANQFYDACQAVGVDYSSVKNAITKRSNIGDHYLDCTKNFRAFGGNCLPKDVNAFRHFAGEAGACELLWRDIITLNEWAEENDEANVA
jgi:UDPglucose 6-dehydrogenase